MRRLGVWLWLGSAAVAVMPALSAQSKPSQCVVISEAGTPERLAGTAAACATRLSPASTYKIPHAVIGLETGVVTTATVERWDGTKYPSQAKWNEDHTVVSAMRPSVLWFFQRMAPRIGAARAHDYLERWKYGNADTSGPISEYWVNGRLRVSPDEQLAFLNRFYAGDLGVRAEHLNAVRGALEQAPGTIENARGVHPIQAQWRDGLHLNAKTGATTLRTGESVSWLVGRLTVDSRAIVFVSAVWQGSGGVDGLTAANAAVEAFKARGLLATRR